MRRPSVYDPDYDPANFVADFPDDEHVQAALKAARELSEQIQPALEGKTPDEQKAYIEAAFKELRGEFDQQLDDFHKTERENMRNEFIRKKEDEIIFRAQEGVKGTSNLDMKVGGAFDRDATLRAFRQNIADNQELKDIMGDRSNKQGARSEAISHAIEYTPPIRTQGKDEPEPEPQDQGPDDPNPNKEICERFEDESDKEFTARSERLNAQAVEDAELNQQSLDFGIRRRAQTMSR